MMSVHEAIMRDLLDAGVRVWGAWIALRVRDRLDAGHVPDRSSRRVGAVHRVGQAVNVLAQPIIRE